MAFSIKQFMCTSIGGGQCTEIAPYHLFASMELKQELGKQLLVFNLNQQCLEKDHQELGAAEGRKMLTVLE